MRIHLMQKDDDYSPWFILQTFDNPQTAKEKAFQLATKRDKAGKRFPKYEINGFKY